jgi:hypothetical protein
VLRLTDNQLTELRLAAAPLPVEARSAFLRTVAGYVALEGDLNEGSFHRALRFALDALPANTP